MAIAVLVVANLWRFALVILAAPAQAMEYNTFTRLDPIALGVLLALFAGRLPALSTWQRITLLAAGVVTWIVTFWFTVVIELPKLSTWQSALGHLLTALASAAILFSVMGSQNAFLRNKWLLYLGKISYGLYVLHEFAHYCAMRLLPASTPMQVIEQSAFSLALTILLAAASYRWLESPFLRLKERFAYVQSRPV
jgi:peptidoglycan/LPS O-acetylase OafA/YrhL